MSYYEPQLARVTGPTKAIAWTLVIVGAVLLIFLAWHQVTEAGHSKRDGIEFNWTGALSIFAGFVVLEIVAFYTAIRRYYGVSIFFGGFTAMFLGIIALIMLSGAGM